LNSSVISDATPSSESTVKANHMDDNIESGSIASYSTARDTDEGDVMNLGSGETDINATLAHLGLSTVDNIDPESLTCLGLLFIANRDTEDEDADEEPTDIAQWNCHEVSVIYLPRLNRSCNSHIE
jgi:hypothetical protein